MGKFFIDQTSLYDPAFLPYRFSLGKVLIGCIFYEEQIISALSVEIDTVGSIFKDRLGINLRHFLVHRKIRKLRIRSEPLEGNDQNNKRKDRRQTRPEHTVPVFLVQLHHFLIIRRLVVGVLLLQLFKFGLHLLHDEILFAHIHALINIEGERNTFEHDCKDDDPETDDPASFDDRLRKFTEPIEPDFISVFEYVNCDRTE